jgi:hypothetical protein
MVPAGLIGKPGCQNISRNFADSQMKNLAFVIAFFAGIAGAHAQSTELDVRNLQVISEGNGISAIRGTATNQSGRELTAAFVKFNLLDERGALVGNAMATASDLAPARLGSSTPRRLCDSQP